MTRISPVPAGLPADEDTVLHVDRSLLQDHCVTDEGYERAVQRFETVGVVELTALIGYYSFLATTVLAHEIPLLHE